MSNPIDSFAVAVCTVDGQQFSFGDVGRRFPIMETVAPLLYALVLRDCGTEETHKVRTHCSTGEEGVAMML
jgi:glutaminase